MAVGDGDVRCEGKGEGRWEAREGREGEMRG